MNRLKVVNRINKVVLSCTTVDQIPMAKSYCILLLESSLPCKRCCNLQVLRHHLADTLFEHQLSLMKGWNEDKKHASLLRNLSRLGDIS
jgi:hypothetical protein